jgi:hypothetical protein
VKGRAPKLPLSDSFVAAVFEQTRVSGMPHEIYRYPARFSPTFAREAILSFTEAGDLVLDPFTGGGTAVAEAIMLGRRAAGVDISALATFLSRAKTTPLSIHDMKAIQRWAERLPTASVIDSLTDTCLEPEALQARHLNREARGFFKTLIDRTQKLKKTRQREFVRLILLATGQSALDCKTMLPSTGALLNEFHDALESALFGFRKFWRDAAAAHAVPPCKLTQFRRILNRSCASCHSDKRIPQNWLPARLVLTSPPYPGVHVLYHRWQILGRRETPAAFWIANQADGAGGSYYTFGPRQQRRRASGKPFHAIATRFRRFSTTTA